MIYFILSAWLRIVVDIDLLYFYHKWGVKTGFTFALQFFMLISDGLGGVVGTLRIQKKMRSS